MKNKNPILWQIEMHLKLISYTSILQDLSKDLRTLNLDKIWSPKHELNYLKAGLMLFFFFPQIIGCILIY